MAKAVGGGYCRLQMPLSLALAVRETVAGHRLGAVNGGGGYPAPPLSNASLGSRGCVAPPYTRRALRDTTAHTVPWGPFPPRHHRPRPPGYTCPICRVADRVAPHKPLVPGDLVWARQAPGECFWPAFVSHPPFPVCALPDDAHVFVVYYLYTGERLEPCCAYAPATEVHRFALTADKTQPSLSREDKAVFRRTLACVYPPYAAGVGAKRKRRRRIAAGPRRPVRPAAPVRSVVATKDSGRPPGRWPGSSGPGPAGGAPAAGPGVHASPTRRMAPYVFLGAS